jgi:hypothetical protein
MLKAQGALQMMENVVNGRRGVAVHSVNKRIIPGLLLSRSERQLCGFLVTANPILNICIQDCDG